MPNNNQRPRPLRARILRAIQVEPEVVTSSVGDDGPLPRVASPSPSFDLDYHLSHRVFPEYIYINWEGFMRASDPLWEPPLEPSSLMYTFQNDNNTGRVTCSNRMAQWLDGLPDARMHAAEAQSEPHQEQEGGAEKGHGNQVQGNSTRQRPRAITLPISGSTGSHNFIAQSFHAGQSNGGLQAPRPKSQHTGRASTSHPIVDLDGVDASDPNAETDRTEVPARDEATPSVTPGPTTKHAISPRLGHSNPLALNAVRIEEIPVQYRIPKRQSSLQHNLRQPQSSLFDNHPAQSAVQDEELVQGVQSIQLGQPVEFQGLAMDPSNRNSTTQVDEDSPMAEAPQLSFTVNGNETLASHSITDKVHKLFGRDSGKKHARSSTPAMIDEPSRKRFCGTLANARNRISMVVTPSTNAAGDGRLSRLSRAISATDRASRRMSLAPNTATLGNASRGLVAHIGAFPSNTEHHKIKVAFVGNTRCGKTTMIQRFFNGPRNAEQKDAQVEAKQLKDGYATKAYNFTIDQTQVNLEAWDVSSQCDVDAAEEKDQIRPMVSTFFDVVVVCFDIQDEKTLADAVTKWKVVAERDCTGAPVFLLGLKADLRPAFFTLRLSHLNEPTAATIGQGEEAARQLGAAAYFECSARTGDGVADFFESVVRFAVERRRSRQQQQQQQQAGTGQKKARKFFQKIVGRRL